MKLSVRLLALLAYLLDAAAAPRLDAAPRTSNTLATGWRSIAVETGTPAPDGLLTPDFDDSAWTTVAVPHNWDRYEGFRQLKHGDRHGSAWYRRAFTVAPADLAPQRRVYLYFEGVGSYATVWVNGHQVGYHAGGLTTFTLDVTSAVHPGADNLLVVQADHPIGIRDLPWVCGGSERAYGFSEGTQPFGLFRPVHLVVTDDVRVVPFGVHLWNDATANHESAVVHATVEVSNASARPRALTVRTRLLDADGHAVTDLRSHVDLAPGTTATIRQPPAHLVRPRLWSLASPHLYTAETSLLDPTAPADAPPLDLTTDTFGVRTIHWPRAAEADGRFYLNGEPVFLNGTCDYEHLLGASHAFGEAQVDARVAMIEAAGYNAFRDAHHPHNLRFNQHWDHDGLLWWTQFGAHIWFDNDAFRANFKALLRDWVRERRNSPSLVLWGLQNESHLPTDFAAECTAIIRELDPTSPEQRLVTTCNGGTGTDWDVPQNWTGTYGGDPATYADDLRGHRLFGEYGAWRSLGLHSEGGFQSKGPLSEERMTALLETKVRLAAVAQNESAGHFHWPFTTHMNPGRHFGENGEQLFDGIRPLDQIGPANNKGVTTIWGEPTDAFYMYRSHFADPQRDPMVYIPLHTWPGRWTEPGHRDGIVVYSNCDEVELFNDLGAVSLGVRPRGAPGVPFTWDDVPVTYNVLYAEGRIAGQVVARDLVHLHHLPTAPAFAAAEAAAATAQAASRTEPTRPAPGAHYLYRVNCGGPAYTDPQGQTWAADRDWTDGDSWGSFSWAQAYPNLPPRFGSQRKTYDPIAGTAADPLYQTFRYGRDELGWRFALPSGDYTVELHFIEPWYGLGGGNAAGWRRFDVALNGATVVTDLDLWHQVGPDHAFVTTAPAHVGSDGLLTVTFPRVAAGQAVISALAIRTATPGLTPPPAPTPWATVTNGEGSPTALRGALDEGDPLDAAGTTFSHLPLELLEADWLPAAATVASSRQLTVHSAATVFSTIALPGFSPTDLALDTVGAHASRLSLWKGPLTAGGTLVVPAGSTLFVLRERPVAPAQFVRLAPAAQTDWQTVGHLRPGLALIADQPLEVARLPQNLSDADLVRALTPTPTHPLDLEALDYVEVHLVQLGPEAPMGDATWTDSRAQLTPHGGDPIALRRTRLAPGEHLVLTAAPAAPVALIARAVRPSFTIPPRQAERGGAATLHHSPDAPVAADFINLPAGPDNFIEWPLALGVGDRYGLAFSYRLSGDTALTGTLTILNAKHEVLRTDPITFPPDDGTTTAWSLLRARTGSSLNAGDYWLRLQLDGVESLELGSLEVE